ncbi:DUF72 domain-containing protein [Bdellovibrio sp. HCB274]|uniref:DUF72 domain-containing protein n=1 Tax=Bdellovibrio sp. HCB274 TaxID=3394361 RepID=UPI0039B47787
MALRIGISGWVYEPWRGVFYPEDLPVKRQLNYASSKVSSIEINGSFYANQKPATYQRWSNEVPEDFCFSIKASRFITHILRLKNCEKALANFFASGLLILEQKLGVILWQLPPSLRFDPHEFEAFLKLLPQTFSEAVNQADQSERYARHYSDHLRTSSRKLKHAFEVRHHSFENPEFIRLLKKYNCALVFADTAGKWPYMEDVTADFIYLRLHGDEEFYVSGYSQESLLWWANRIRLWQNGTQARDALTLTDNAPSKKKRDVFVYFDNDLKVKAPFDALTLMKILNAEKTDNVTASRP